MKHTIKILIECENNVAYDEIEEYLHNFKSDVENAEGNCEGIVLKWEEIRKLSKKEV